MSNSLRPHGLQHARLPCPSSTPGVHFRWVGDAIQPSHPHCALLLAPSIFLSIRVFSNESVLHIRQSKYWSFSISPSNEYTGLISFRDSWFDLLAVQGTLTSLLQHYCSKASVLWCSAFFTVQSLQNAHCFDPSILCWLFWVFCLSTSSVCWYL